MGSMVVHRSVVRHLEPHVRLPCQGPLPRIPTDRLCKEPGELMRLSGKIAVVSGAAQGIGRAAALRFGREGATVVCADIQETAEVTAKDVVATGGTATSVVMDVTVAADWERTVQTTLDGYGRIDLLATSPASSRSTVLTRSWA